MRRVLAATGVATLALTPPAAAFTPGEHVRIVGPDFMKGGWPVLTDGQPGFVEAGRQAAAAVRTVPVLPAERALRAPAERAAAFELAKMLRAARELRHAPGTPPSEVVVRPFAALGNGDSGRLRPEHILFNAPHAVRAHAPPPALEGEAETGAVPVPVAAPRQPREKAVPRIHPRRPGIPIVAEPVDVPGAPVPRPAPRVPAIAAPPEGGALGLSPSAEPAAGALAPDPAAPGAPVPWEATEAAGTARAAAATPFITLWPSAPRGEEAAAEPPPPPDLPPGPEPYELVRMLTALQDDIARGAGAALAAQGVLQRRIEERFAASLPEEWAEPRNARALVIYALSGGNPPVVRAVLERATLAPPNDALAAGALAYLEGRANDARRHFDSVAALPLDASVAGSVHLARAALAVQTDPSGALALLERARATAPGSLVEEAALRRAVLVAAEMDDVAAFEHLVARYLRKFRRSLYAGNFRQRLASAVTRMSFVREPAAFVRLEAMLEPMTDAGRQELYLLLARAAIETGNRLAAGIAADRALATATAESLDARRAALYRAAAEVVDPQKFEAAVATLRELESAELPEDDRAILFAALRLSRTVTELPRPAPGAFGRGGLPAAEEDGAASDAESPFAGRFDVAAVERRVSEAIARVDALLEDTP